MEAGRCHDGGLLWCFKPLFACLLFGSGFSVWTILENE